MLRTALVYLNRGQHHSPGVGYIASSIMAAGHSVEFFDTFYRPLKDVAFSVVEGEYDILLVSGSSLFWKQAVELARGVKQFSSMLILFGGLHATIVQGEVLGTCPDIDYICVGEGEEFVAELLNTMENGGSVRSIDNLGYRARDGTIVINPVRPATDLNSLPRINYGMFAPGSVVQPGPIPGFCYVFATRGCPYNCSYCGNGVLLKMYRKSFLRTRNIDSVIAEMAWLMENYPVEFFYFGDEMILFDEPYVIELFERVKSDLNMPYGCMTRVERVTPSVVDLLRRTGCGYVAMGIECGNEQYRREFLNRQMSNEQIINAYAALRTIPGIALTAFGMKGWPVPHDDELTKETLALMDLVRPDHRQVSTMYPFPGTRVRQYCEENDLLDPEKLERVEDVFSESVLRDWPKGEAT